MYNYINGIIDEVTPNKIVIDNHGIGYDVIVPNPYSYQENKEYKIYVYHQITENSQDLFGFQSKEEKDLFLRLINVKGLGPRTAIPMFATGSTTGIIYAIDREHILYLKKFPKIGDKVARQIILDLKGKLASTGTAVNDNYNDELSDALTALGYKQADVKKIIKSVDKDLSIENQIKEALKLLLK